MKHIKPKLFLSLFIILLSDFSFCANSTENRTASHFHLESSEDIKYLLEIMDPNGRENQRLHSLNILSPEEFSRLLAYLMAPIGGEAIKHWAYNPTFSTKELNEDPFYSREHDHSHGFEADYFYMTPSAMALQYILFFLEYKVTDQEEGKMRAQKVAAALNHLGAEQASDIIYGRFDTRFLRENDRLTLKSELPEDEQVKATLKDKFTKKMWLYEKKKIKRGRQIYNKKRNSVFYENTVRARMPLPFVRSLTPYLDQSILSVMVKKEDYLSQNQLRTEL